MPNDRHRTAFRHRRDHTSTTRTSGTSPADAVRDWASAHPERFWARVMDALVEAGVTRASS
ncbi:hypothetical protein ACRAWF_41540 [Streptomyces sp. L7]